jgi:hypothetical protein
MKKILLLLVLLAAVAPAPAFADQSSHRDAALRLLEVTETQKMLDQMMSAVDTMMLQQFDAMGLPPEGREAADAMRVEVMQWFSDFFVWEEMRDLFVDIYVEVFSKEEIDEMVSFYESPLGQKMLAKMPALMQKSMEKTQAMLQEKLPQLQQRMQNVMAELEEKYRQ